MRSSGQSCCCSSTMLHPASRPRSTSCWNWSDADVRISAWMARLSALLLLSVLNGAWVPPGLAQADPVIAAAGDIACDPADESFNGGGGATNARPRKNKSGLLLEMNTARGLCTGDTPIVEGGLPRCFTGYS